jgi:hypothetical protein
VANKVRLYTRMEIYCHPGIQGEIRLYSLFGWLRQITYFSKYGTEFNLPKEHYRDVLSLPSDVDILFLLRDELIES